MTSLQLCALYSSELWSRLAHSITTLEQGDLRPRWLRQFNSAYAGSESNPCPSRAQLVSLPLQPRHWSNSLSTVLTVHLVNMYSSSAPFRTPEILANSGRHMALDHIFAGDRCSTGVPFKCPADSNRILLLMRASLRCLQALWHLPPTLALLPSCSETGAKQRIRSRGPTTFLTSAESPAPLDQRSPAPDPGRHSTLHTMTSRLRLLLLLAFCSVPSALAEKASGVLDHELVDSPAASRRCFLGICIPSKSPRRDILDPHLLNGAADPFLGYVASSPDDFGEPALRGGNRHHVQATSQYNTREDTVSWYVARGFGSCSQTSEV